MAAKDDDETTDLKEVIKLAKLRAMNFALAPGKGEPLVILADKRKDPSRLRESVRKKGGESAKMVAGTLSVRGSELVLNTQDKVTPAHIKALKEMLKAVKIQLKPVAPGVSDDDEEAGPAPELLKGIAASVGDAAKLAGRQIEELGKKLKAGGDGPDKEIAEAIKRTASALDDAVKHVAEAARKAAGEPDGGKRGKLAEGIGKALKDLNQSLSDQKVKDLARTEVEAVGALSKAVREAMAGLK